MKFNSIHSSVKACAFVASLLTLLTACGHADNRSGNDGSGSDSSGLVVRSITPGEGLLIAGREAVFRVEIGNEGTTVAEGWTIRLDESRLEGPALAPGERTVVDFRKTFDYAGWKTLSARIGEGVEKTFDIYCFMDPDLRSRYNLFRAELRRYFEYPPNEYRLIYYSHDLEPDFATNLRNYGVGGIIAFMDKFLDPRRSGDRSEIQKRVEFANSLGMRIWLGDDFGYPSGMAGGRVVEENPGFEVRGLMRISATGSGESQARIALPDEVERAVAAVLYPVVDGAADFAAGRTVPVNGRVVETLEIEGPWQLHVFGTVVRDRDTQAQSTMRRFGHTGRYPDLLNPDAVDRFIELMYQSQADEITEFSERTYGLYSNEANLMQVHWVWDRDAPYAFVSWNDAIPDEFRKMHGYDLLPNLGAVFEGDHAEDRRTRMHFHQTVGKMLSENYARRLTEWADANGTFSSGHFLLNDYLSMHVACYGDLMKFISELHIPGVDTGIPDPHEMEGWPYQQNKLFSSIAAWKDVDTVNTLLDPIIMGRGLMRMSPEVPVMRNISNRVMLNGSNQLHTYTPLYRREPNPNHVRPSAAAGYTEEEFRGLNEYIGRISVLLRGARNETAVAIYYPIAMFQADFKPSREHWRKIVEEYEERQQAFERVEQAFVEHGMDYNIVHPEAVASADVADGFLVIGAHRYRYLVMPGMDMIPQGVLERLERFKAGGGNVLWLDTVPAMGAYGAEDEVVTAKLREVTPIAAHSIIKTVREPFAPEFSLRVGGAADDVLIGRFRRQDQRIYFLVNTSGEEVSVEISAGAAQSIEVYDPLTGDISARSLPFEAQIIGYSSLLLVE
jgi:hypothetical protein